MTETPNEKSEMSAFQQTDFERITQIVTAEFQVEDSLMEYGTPTYYLKWPQETKQAFLRLLRTLEEMKLIAFLRKVNGRVVLRVVVKPAVKPSDPKDLLGFFLRHCCYDIRCGLLEFRRKWLEPVLNWGDFLGGYNDGARCSRDGS